MKELKEILSLAKEEQADHKEYLTEYVIAEKKFRLTERRLKELEENIAYKLKRLINPVIVEYNKDPILGIKIEKFKLRYFQSHANVFIVVEHLTHLNKPVERIESLPERFSLLLVESLSVKLNNALASVVETIKLADIRIKLS